MTVKLPVGGGKCVSTVSRHRRARRWPRVPPAGGGEGEGGAMSARTGTIF